MKESHFSKKVKSLRTSKGMSQEELADVTGLSLRTIQRIENNETEPRGDSLKRLAQALNTTPDEIIEWRVEEDPNYLIMMAFGSFAFLLFPLLGIIIPLIFWVLKKDKMHSVDHLGKAIINFQLTWTLVMGLNIILFLTLIFSGFLEVENAWYQPWYFIITLFLIYLIVLIVSFINVFRIYKNRTFNYQPALKILK
jgi:transcriptional regulator with XRE-family HTH domain